MKKFFFSSIILSAAILISGVAGATPCEPAGSINTDQLSLSYEFGYSCVSHQVERTYLGVRSEQDDQGARIVDVMPNSPAKKAGLQKDDIITNVDGQDIDGPEKLAEVVAGLKPDQKVKVSILRDGKKDSVFVVLGLMEDNFRDYGQIPGPQQRPFIMPQPQPFQWYGNPMQPPRYRIPGMPNPYNGNPYLNIPRTMKPELGLQIENTENDGGVTVVEVRAGTPADEAGIRQGDLITAINGQQIRNVNDAIAHINRADGREYKIDLTRGKKKLQITVKTRKPLPRADI